MSYSRLAARGQLRTRLPVHVPYDHRESPVVLPLHLTVPLYHFSEWPSLPKEMNVVEVHEVVLELDARFPAGYTWPLPPRSFGGRERGELGLGVLSELCLESFLHLSVLLKCSKL